MLLIKNTFISASIVFYLFYNSALYAQQSEGLNYETIQRSYSINYNHLEDLYVSFFYPNDENKSNEFLIDSSVKTEDERITEKEPLGYDIKLEKLQPKTEISIGDIEVSHEGNSK